MQDESPTTIYLKDYTPPAWLVEDVALTFHLNPNVTRVKSRIRFAPNPNAASHPFFLHGEQLRLISARINGEEITPEITPEGLRAEVPAEPFEWEAEVEIAPEGNTALEGLYMSNGMYCTQCEAEGFRKITYYPDRPDVMAPFKVRVESDLPVMLSNGNPVGRGEGWAEWHDPWPKPAYLFALVAGDLAAHSDQFTTASGRDVALNIWVRAGDLNKCAFAMDALKASMRWDEEAYGREYDLDMFNIVAVDDFNMGAMENKGLNIFNSAVVLASPETSTDMNFERIEAIIAHEYFHNWTGNRITCRDWFQLCLKEGLTVFRDQHFTADLRSEPVKRIADVQTLRERQFPEDQGPLAHPVRPACFQEINNFYTATVYEKGAEIIRMLRLLVGEQAYGEALDLYFTRHDGQAITIEDWLAVFTDITGRDLSQFHRWYTQSGTPHLSVRESFEDGALVLHFRQHTPPTPDQAEKAPLVIPVAVGLLDESGEEVLPTRVIEVSEAEQSVRFPGFEKAPVASVLRGFSAPVVLDHPQDSARKLFLMRHDSDAFNRWQAGRDLALHTLGTLTGGTGEVSPTYLSALAEVVCDPRLEPAFRAQLLSLPSEAGFYREHGNGGDPMAVAQAFETLRNAQAHALESALPELLEASRINAPYQPDATQSGLRALGSRALSLLTRLDQGEAAQQLYQRADNMTLQLAALACLVRSGKGGAALEGFYDHWREDRLVIDKWFALQVSEASPQEAAATAERLMQHPDFEWKNPNRFRAVALSLAGNHAGFHHESGAAYALLAEWLIRVDGANPQLAARCCGVFQAWKHYDPDRQSRMQAQLERIASAPNLSRDSQEMVSRMLVQKS